MNALRTARCYAEMVAGMVAGMILLEPLWPAVTTATTTPVGWQAMVMATNMSIGMTAVMLLRRHRLCSTLIMCAAMYAPFILLLPPYRAGWLDTDAYFHSGHLLMFALMLLLVRRSTTAPQPTATFPGILPASPSAPSHLNTASTPEGNSS